MFIIHSKEGNKNYKLRPDMPKKGDKGAIKVVKMRNV